MINTTIDSNRHPVGISRTTAIPENIIIANSQFNGFMDLTGFVCAV